MKRCTKCGTERDESEFHRNKRSIDGLHHHCKQCRVVYSRNNKDRSAEYSRLYHIENKDKDAESDRLYRIENKDLISKQMKEYRLENQPVLKEYQREYDKGRRAVDPPGPANRLKAWLQKNKERVREIKMRYKLKSEHPMNPTTITDPILVGKIIDMKQTGMRVCDIAPKLSMESGKRITQSAIWRLFDSMKEEPIPELLESDYPSLQDISYIFNIKFKKEKTSTVMTYHNTTIRRDLLQRILTKFYKKNFTYYDVKYECNDRDTDTAFLNHWEYLLHNHYIEQITDTEFGFCDVVKRWHMKLL